jgi:hypothetical protein
MRTPINDACVALPGSPAVGAITAGVSGCGGAAGGGGDCSAGSGASSAATSSAWRYAPTPPAAASTDIAQQHGGDHDTNKNGGPSDGDGNL